MSHETLPEGSWQDKGLPDYIRPHMKILFVGINPGKRSAEVGHHYAGYSNRFWKLLYDSGYIGGHKDNPTL